MQVRDASVLREGSYCGTPEYMAPEMLARRPYDGRIDFWGLGCLLFELITNKSPFQVLPHLPCSGRARARKRMRRPRVPFASLPPSLWPRHVSWPCLMRLRVLVWCSGPQHPAIVDVVRNVLAGAVTYPPTVRSDARAAIARLLSVDVFQRPGSVEALAQLPFYAEVDWDRLGEGPGPFMPMLMPPMQETQPAGPGEVSVASPEPLPNGPVTFLARDAPAIGECSSDEEENALAHQHDTDPAQMDVVALYLAPLGNGSLPPPT